MTDQTLPDAVAFPEDDGTGVSDGDEDYDSAAYFSLLSKYKGDGTYVGEDTSGSATLQFANVDTTNEQVDIGTGYAYIMDSGNSVQSGSQTSYDTTLPVDNPYVVILPNTVVDVDLDADSVNDIWLAVDPTTNDNVYLRFGSGLSAPSDPSIKLGTVDTSSGSTTRPNDLASNTLNTSVANNLSVEDSLTDPSGVAHTAELADSVDIRTNEEIQDVVGGLIQANGNISVTYDDGNNVLTVDTNALNEEEVEDAVAALVSAGNAITVNYDDANDALSIAVDESNLSFYDGTNLTANVDNQSVSTDEEVIGSGPIRAEIITDADPAEANFRTVCFRSIQSAIDAIPTLSGQSVSRGKVTVGALGGNSSQRSYQENITIDEYRIILEGQGKSTKVEASGAATEAPTLEVNASDDTEIRDIWLDNSWSDNTTGGDVLQVNGGECYVDKLNVDHAGRYAVNMDGRRNFLANAEIKDGDVAAVRMAQEQSSIYNCLIHDELNQGVPTAIRFGDHQRLKLDRLWIMTQGERAFDWEGNANGAIQYSNIYIGPSPETNSLSSLTEDVDMRGNQTCATNVVIYGTGLNLWATNDFDFWGYVDPAESITLGTRASINGKGQNNGDPRVTGGWNGYAERAYNRGVQVIWDTSVSDPVAYEPKPLGSGTYGWQRSDHPQELHREQSPDGTTTTYDPKTDLGSGDYRILISAVNGEASGEVRGFRGSYRLRHDAANATQTVAEDLTVEGYGTNHTASVDTDGVITFGTSASTSIRGTIIVDVVELE